MPHCTTDYAWYLGKFLLGFTGILILYMGFLKDKEYAYSCKPGMGNPLTDETGENDNMCSTGDRRGANAQKQCGQRTMIAHAKNRCSWYANRGKCSERERCYPRVIASKYLVKSNNAIEVKNHWCSCAQKHGKLVELTLNPERRRSYKCRWCTSFSRYSCARQKSNHLRKRTCLRTPFSQDTIADLWNVERVCEGLNCVRSQDNDLSKENIGQYQEESRNVEKLAQEETTSSSYVDAKNSFVQDACIQTIRENREETCLERFSDQRVKKEKEDTVPSKDSSFKYYEHNEMKLEDKLEQTSLNCDCELPFVEEPMNSVNVETSVSLEQLKKSNINEMRGVSSSCTCVPYVPELRLERKCGCHPAFNSKYQFVERRFNENEIENRQKHDERCQTSRLCDTRNRWSSEITSPSSCESNRCTSDDLRSSTSTESTNRSQAKTKMMCVNRDRGPSLYFDKSIKIGKGPWRRNDEMILKNSTSSSIHKINTKEDYSDQRNQFMCYCDDMSQEVMPDSKFNYTETGRSRTSFSSTSFSSYDRDRSPRSFSRYINCRCRNLASVASSASTCTESLASEIEYRRVKESSKALNPLLLKSTITYGNNTNGRFHNTRFSSQRTLYVRQRRWKKNCLRTRNDLCD